MLPDPDPRWRVLLLGPRSPGDGGIVGLELAFHRLVQRFFESGTFAVDLADASRPAWVSDVVRRWLDGVGWQARLCWRVFAAAHRCDLVLFSAPAEDVLDAGPFVWAAARVCGLPLAVRVSGGGLHALHARLPAWRRSVCDRSVLSAPLLLLQTRGLCERFADRLGARWHPPTREMVGGDEGRGACRRFLFLSALRPERGIAEALAASDALPPGASLTVAGAAAPGFDPAKIEGHANARWIGAVEPAGVPVLLHEHDALVFPSWSETDGLPGAVIEALQCGLPVIAARSGAIEELVQEEVTGLLVRRRSAEELERAMTRLATDAGLFTRLSAAARAAGQGFRPGLWHEELEDWLFQLCDQGVLSRTLPFYERKGTSWRRTG
jgi:Glycosyl transferases group 1